MRLGTTDGPQHHVETMHLAETCVLIELPTTTTRQWLTKRHDEGRTATSPPVTWHHRLDPSTNTTRQQAAKCHDERRTSCDLAVSWHHRRGPRTTGPCGKRRSSPRRAMLCIFMLDIAFFKITALQWHGSVPAVFTNHEGPT